MSVNEEIYKACCDTLREKLINMVKTDSIYLRVINDDTLIVELRKRGGLNFHTEILGFVNEYCFANKNLYDLAKQIVLAYKKIVLDEYFK